MSGLRSSAPPIGFSNVFEKNESGKVVTFLRCTKMGFDPGLKHNVQCHYKIRKDSFKGKPHKCIFSNLDSYIVNNPPKLCDSLNNLENCVFEFVGKKNISISTSVSDEFYNLLREFYLKGQNNPQIVFETIYPKISRTTFTKRFIMYSESLKKECLKGFCGYACLAVDGGKVGPNSILNCILINPFKNLTPLLYEGIRNFGGNYDSYVKELTRIIKELEIQRIIVTGVVTDNLKVQVMALDHRCERSVQQLSNNSIVKSIIRIPCQCHVISLALKDLKDTVFLENVEDNLKTVIKSFRSKKFKKWIKCICPKLCPTRWTNMYDVLFFMVKNMQRLVCIINTPNPVVSAEVDSFRVEYEKVIFEIVPNLYLFFYLFKRLIDIIERDNTLAADCPMIYANFFQLTQDYVKKMNNSQLDLLCFLFINSIKRRLLHTGNFHLLLFLSSFTLEGRKLIREEFSDSEMLQDDGDTIQSGKNYEFLSINDDQNLNEFINEIYPKILIAKENYNNNRGSFAMIENLLGNYDEYSDYDDDMSSDEIDMNNSHQAMINFADYDENENDRFESTYSIDEINLYLDYSPIEYSIEFFKEYSTINNFETSEMYKINDCYLNWIIHPIHETIYWTKNFTSPYDIWNALSLTKKWKEMAKIAIRYLSITSSEASAERMFSLQRFAISKHRYRTKKKLEESKMVFHSL